jgi:hypothetical protein
MLCAASRSILSSNRRTVSCKSSACYFSAATVSTNQDAEVAVTLPQQRYPANHQPKSHHASGGSGQDRHCSASPQDRQDGRRHYLIRAIPYQDPSKRLHGSRRCTRLGSRSSPGSERKSRPDPQWSTAETRDRRSARWPRWPTSGGRWRAHVTADGQRVRVGRVMGRTRTPLRRQAEEYFPRRPASCLGLNGLRRQGMHGWRWQGRSRGPRACGLAIRLDHPLWCGRARGTLSA